MNDDHVRMAIAIVGAGLAGIGAGLHYLPLGFIAGGAMLFAIALIGALRAKG